MAEKNSFILHLKYGSIFAEMSDKQAGVLIKAIFNYIATGKTMEGLNDVEVKTAFKFIKLDLDYNNAKYTDLCEKRAAWGRKGGKPKKAEAEAFTESISLQDKHKPPYALNESISKHNDVVVDVDIDIEKEKLKKEKAELTALPPLFAEFWEKYPKKTTRKECLDWWKKNPGKRQAAIAGLSWYIRNTDPQYYLDPIRYLKRERWQDKPEDWQEPRVSAKPQEPQISAEERAEQERWNSLTEEERKAELDAYMAESGGPWKPGG